MPEKRQDVIDAARRSWLKQTKHVLAADHADAEKGLQGFPSNPGCGPSDDRCENPSYYSQGKYLGAHRALAGILRANDTYGSDIDWIAVVDDDNYLALSYISPWLRGFDARLPLFIARPVGTGPVPGWCANNVRMTPTGPEPVKPQRLLNPCCRDARAPCPINLPQRKPAVWSYDNSSHRFSTVPDDCSDPESKGYECCR
eukprot:6210738-Pleurochrysis_carterae.AAC.3